MRAGLGAWRRAWLVPSLQPPVPSTWLPTRLAWAAAGRGSIVNIGSVAGLKGVADEGAYSVSKWAVRGWSAGCYEASPGEAAPHAGSSGQCSLKSCDPAASPSVAPALPLPQALRAHGIKVTCIEPSHVATDMALKQVGARCTAEAVALVCTRCIGIVQNASDAPTYWHAQTSPSALPSALRRRAAGTSGWIPRS